ncbi:MAG: hypothetical protein ACTTKB_03180 [Treponema sp.]
MKEKGLKKKSRTLLLLSLLLIPATQTLYAESGNPSPSVSGTRFNLESSKNYTAKEVQEVLDIVIEEAEKSITEAYNAGYKQGVLEFKPEVSYWQTEAENYKRQYLLERRKKWQWALGGAGLGFIGGASLSLTLHLRY